MEQRKIRLTFIDTCLWITLKRCENQFETKIVCVCVINKKKAYEMLHGIELTLENDSLSWQRRRSFNYMKKT